MLKLFSSHIYPFFLFFSGLCVCTYQTVGSHEALKEGNKEHRRYVSPLGVVVGEAFCGSILYQESGREGERDREIVSLLSLCSLFALSLSFFLKPRIYTFLFPEQIVLSHQYWSCGGACDYWISIPPPSFQ